MLQLHLLNDQVIDDKNAYAKTSQALREGQTKIRQKMHSEKAGQSNYDTSLLATSSSYDNPREVSAEVYFGYSVQVLESLYKADDKNDST